MSTTPVPGEQDAVALEESLDALYRSLPPQQQALLDAVITAGLSLLSNPADTAGFLNFADMRSAQAFMRGRAAAATGEAPDLPDAMAPERGRRWQLRPVAAWLKGERG
jgi:hypothetical protein